ncbi:hypothetical protein EV361DRAFT_513088 [Lentinula raphanica]|nr:hypothetical protein EV361DRAFT_513088 [Lentinula raphanica]
MYNTKIGEPLHSSASSGVRKARTGPCDRPPSACFDNEQSSVRKAKARLSNSVSIDGCGIFTTLVVEVKICRSKLSLTPILPSIILILPKPTSTLKIRSIVAFEAQAVKSMRNMRLRYSCCGTKFAILGVLSVFCTVAAAPIKAPFQSFPSFRELDSVNLYDSHMNLRSSNDVGVSTWTVTIMFMDKPQLSVGSQMQSDAPPVFDNKLLLDSEDKSQFSGGSLTQSDARPVFQSVATALQPRLPESDTLFLLPHWGSIPCWNKHQKIEFHYFVQQGLPLKSGTRTEKEFGTGHVKKKKDGVLRTTIDSDKSGTNPKKTEDLHTSSSSSSTSNEFYVVDSEMNRHDPFKDSYQ